MSRIFGVLLFENFELLDVFGPLELFGILGVDRIEVVLIAQSEGLVKSKQGPAVLAEFSFENAPAIDILLVPGGQGTRIEVLNQTLLNWIQRVSRSAELTLSVCTGAALLAKAGILNGHQATTNKASFQWVSEQKYESKYFTANIEDNNIIDTTKEIDWVYVARWVESGNVWTSSGFCLLSFNIVMA
jgi:putative intracellular protease/amidase